MAAFDGVGAAAGSVAVEGFHASGIPGFSDGSADPLLPGSPAVDPPVVGDRAAEGERPGPGSEERLELGSAVAQEHEIVGARDRSEERAARSAVEDADLRAVPEE